MATLLDRFRGPDLIEALTRQRLVNGDHEIAAAFAGTGELKELEPGDVLITQGDWDTDLYFILAGDFDVIINGRTMATRSSGIHVGEIVGLNQARARTATLRAKTKAIVLKVTSADMRMLIEDKPQIWRTIADIISSKLDERNAQIGAANEHPRIFVISSSEGLKVARRVRANLDSPTMAVQLWDKGTFGVSAYPMSSLDDAIEGADFVIAVVRADDSLITRKQEVKSVARDNVHLEYGMAVGKLGLGRAFLLVNGTDEVSLPSDLAGLTTLRYRDGNSDNDDEMVRTVARACDEARTKIEYTGVRRDRQVR